VKLGIFSKVYLNYELEIALHKIKAQGMSTVQFNFANVGLASLPKEISQEIILQIKEATIRSGVNIAVISGTFNTLELNEEKKVENQQCFKNVVETAAALAVPYVSISTGSLNQEDFWSPHPENYSERAWSILYESLAWMLEIAKENQVTLVFEPEQANVVSTTEDALRLLQDLNTPYLKVLYDAANLLTPQDHKDLLDKISKTLTTLKEHIAIAHCKDAFVNEEKITFASVGKGNLPLKEYLNELSKVYDGPVIMHGLAEDDVAHALNYLN